MMIFRIRYQNWVALYLLSNDIVSFGFFGGKWVVKVLSTSLQLHLNLSGLLAEIFVHVVCPTGRGF